MQENPPKKRNNQNFEVSLWRRNSMFSRLDSFKEILKTSYTHTHANDDVTLDRIIKNIYRHN